MYIVPRQIEVSTFEGGIVQVILEEEKGEVITVELSKEQQVELVNLIVGKGSFEFTSTER